jgi:hypothetical protein
MSAPERVQLRRTRGWRMPPNTVKVDRTTKWGNPFRRAGSTQCPVASFRDWATQRRTAQAWDYADEARRELRGKNLACWCKPGEPCHADVLLEIANSEDPL